MSRIRFNLVVKLLLLLALFFSLQIWGHALPDVLVNLRFYEGIRQQDIDKSGVVTSYYLKSSFPGSMVLDIKLGEEQGEISKIFNLKDIKVISQADWAWKETGEPKQFELIVLNGHKFGIQVTLLKATDQFNLKVTEKGEGQEKKVLESELQLPQEKTSIFGFEDSTGKPYYLALQRQKDRSGIAHKEGDVATVTRPILVKKASPAYPEAAKKERVQGTVVLEAVTDETGNVEDISRVEGHPLLIDAAIEALSQWKYEPYKINGKPQPLRFTVTFAFKLSEEEAAAAKPVTTQEQPVTLDPAIKPVLIDKVAPVYPEEAKKKKIGGVVGIEAVVDEKGHVSGIDMVKGAPLLVKAATEAVKQWTYKPYLVNGQPKAFKMTLTVSFNLEK